MHVIYSKACGIDVHKTFIVAVIKGEKDDNKNAKWIADLFKMGIVCSSFFPSKDFRVLRELTRYIYKVICICLWYHFYNRTKTKN